MRNAMIFQLIRKMISRQKPLQVEKEKEPEHEPRDWSYRVIWRRKIKNGVVTTKFVVQRYERYQDDEADFATWEDKKQFDTLDKANKYAAEQMQKDVRRDTVEEMVMK